MKTIGLIGGMSWESSASYYKMLNLGIQQRFGGLHSAKIILVSVDFAEIEALQDSGDWDKAADILGKAAKSLEMAGADFFLICTNTMHKVADLVRQTVNIPLLHIADATGQQLKSDNITKVGLLGTQFTMAQSFYKKRISNSFGIKVLVPSESEQEMIHQIIYQELCLGVINDTSRQHFLTIIDSLVSRGAKGIILGCTEIGLLVKNEHTSAQLFDTTAIHVQAAIDYSLK